MTTNRKQYKNSEAHKTLNYFFLLTAFIDFSHLCLIRDIQQIHKKEYKAKNGTHKDILVFFAFSSGGEYACFFKIQQWHNKDGI